MNSESLALINPPTTTRAKKQLKSLEKKILSKGGGGSTASLNYGAPVPNYYIDSNNSRLIVKFVTVNIGGKEIEIY